MAAADLMKEKLTQNVATRYKNQIDLILSNKSFVLKVVSLLKHFEFELD